MSETTAHLALPFIIAAQAQKHVTMNEALRMLDGIVQLAVLDRDLTAPPSSPAEGDRYIPATGATGAWAGWDGNIAYWVDGAWLKLVPQPGWIAWVVDESSLIGWTGSSWEAVGASSDPLFSTVGIGGASGDPTNRLSVNADATLLNNAGGGHQMKINKNAAGDTASMLFQSAWTGYAEMGLAGDNDFAIKVFDGSSWYEAIKVDPPNHQVQFSGSPVVESGSSGNGSWIKYYDGTLVCSHEVVMGSVVAVGAGTFANPYQTAAVAWSYPQSFVSLPAVSATPVVGFGTNNRNAMSAYVRNVSLTGLYVTALRNSSANDPDTPSVHLIAMGRWK